MCGRRTYSRWNYYDTELTLNAIEYAFDCVCSFLIPNFQFEILSFSANRKVNLVAIVIIMYYIFSKIRRKFVRYMHWMLTWYCLRQIIFKCTTINEWGIGLVLRHTTFQAHFIATHHRKVWPKVHTSSIFVHFIGLLIEKVEFNVTLNLFYRGRHHGQGYSDESRDFILKSENVCSQKIKSYELCCNQLQQREWEYCWFTLQPRI